MPKIAFTPVLALLLVACTGTTTPSPLPPPSPATTDVPSTATLEPPPTGKEVTYEDPDGRFTIDVPKKWKPADEAKGCPTTICFEAPKQEGVIRAIIMVSVFPDQTELGNLQTGWNTLRQLVIDSWGVDAKTVDGTGKDTMMSDMDAKTATYDITWEIGEGMMVQTMTMDADIVYYMVTGGSASSIWPDEEPIFKDATTSFTVT